MMKLPKSLKHEPLLEATFEVRLNSQPSLVDVLPGCLFRELEPTPSIERLMQADIPQGLRDQVPDLQFSPLLRMEWRQNYLILLGDRSMAISCKPPYPKWPEFKRIILEIVQHIVSIGITGSVVRYSMKYVNLIQAQTPAEQLAKLEMEIQLGTTAASDEHMNIYVQRREEDIVHRLSIVTGATANDHSGKQLSGVVVDVDSIREVDSPELHSFFSDLKPNLEHLRQANKEKFFGCLKQSTIDEMGPEYD